MKLNMDEFPMLTARSLLLSVVLLSVGCTTAAPTIQTGLDAETSFDGLNRVDNSQADLAWARPDFDISGYTKLLPIAAEFEYRPSANRGRTSIERNRGGPYFIDDKARARFEELVAKVFQEELAKVDGWEFVTESGPDVLIIRGAMLDITSYVPPELTGRSEVFLSSIGEATLVLELRDSETGTILARSIDRRAAERIGNTMTNSNRVTNASEVRRLVRFWARRLVDGLNGFSDRSGE